MVSFALAVVVAAVQKPQDFPDTVFKIARYPGSTTADRSSTRIGIDMPWASFPYEQQHGRKGWGRMYSSKDDWKLLREFYKREGQKIGDLRNLGHGNNAALFRYQVDMANGDWLIIRGQSLGKNESMVELYYLLKNK